jgi:hypothetical protein
VQSSTQDGTRQHHTRDMGRDKQRHLNITHMQDRQAGRKSVAAQHPDPIMPLTWTGMSRNIIRC